MTEGGRPVVWLDVVGLTPRLLAHAPNLGALSRRGSTRPLRGVLPAVTCTAQATALTGSAPSEHGIVGNGWFHRGTGEVRFWLQSNALIGGETVYAAARRRAQELRRPFSSAKLFWWFNQGAPVDVSVTPKPWYGADGSKAFGIQSRPPALASDLERALGAFPFRSFWGPAAGLPSSRWIAEAAARVLREKKPSLTLIYLPHLDYDLQRFGPDHADTPARVAEVDAAAALVIDAAHEIGAEVTAFSEYGLASVSRFETPNRALREAGLLAVRDGPFGETLDPFESRAFAVCDHQVAHVHATDAGALEKAREVLSGLAGVERLLSGEARKDVGLDHPRAGDLVAFAKRDAWFAYPYWLDDRRAPDFARTVDIHRKPGYDPCELFLDPALSFPKWRVARRLAAKKLGLRMLMDVVPLDPSLVRGSHGLDPNSPDEGPVLVSEDPEAATRVASLGDLKAHALDRLGLR